MTWGKAAAWTAYAAAGALWGGREAFHADPTVFERKWGVSETSFFGSEQWRRQYIGNNPEKGHKRPEAFNVFRDYWHFSGAASRTTWLSVTFAIGAEKKQPLRHKALDVGIGMALSALAANVAYHCLRN